MRVVSWNVNSVRVRLPRLLALLARARPDVVCLQETKVDDPLFPHAALREAGYHAVVAGQKGYNGVAILARRRPRAVVAHLGDGHADPQARLLAASCGGVRVLCAYVPNGVAMGTPSAAYKRAWYARLRAYLDRHLDPARPVVLCGDFNVAPREVDVWDVKRWQKTVVFHPEMRAALASVIGWGLTDVFAAQHPQGGLYSWWDYRTDGFTHGRGLRIDAIFASPPLAARCTATSIDRDERAGERPSDHAPVLADFRLPAAGAGALGRRRPRLKATTHRA